MSQFDGSNLPLFLNQVQASRKELPISTLIKLIESHRWEFGL